MPDPLYITLTNEYRQRLIDREQSFQRDMARRWLAIERQLNNDFIELAELANQQYEQSGKFSREDLYQLNRYTALLAQLRQQLIRFNILSESQVNQLVIDAVLDGLSNPIELINAVAAANLFFDRLGIEAAENIAAVARTGQPLNTILSRNYPATVNAITDQLLTGVAAGYNPRKIANNIIKNGLSQGLNHILLVARDQANRAYREASRQQYQQSGLVTSYIRIAAKQPGRTSKQPGRTCLACLALDGTEYATDDFMAVHPQDRCAMIPVVRRYPKPTFPAGEVYFNSLDTNIQRQWMGEARYELWKAGQFQFKDMAKIHQNDTWGPSVQVRPVKELV